MGSLKEISKSIYTFSGVLLEKDILMLPQLQRTFCSIVANCFARSAPYGQFPRKNIMYIQYENRSNTQGMEGRTV
jgi:hypothetical protein